MSGIPEIPYVPPGRAREEGLTRGEELWREFDEFHTRNPHVYSLLEKEAVHLAKERKRFGVKDCVERLRWDHDDIDTSDPVFKLNDKYTSRYARMLLLNHPEWKGKIETRRLRS